MGFHTLGPAGPAFPAVSSFRLLPVLNYHYCCLQKISIATTADEFAHVAGAVDFIYWKLRNFVCFPAVGRGRSQGEEGRLELWQHGGTVCSAGGGFKRRGKGLKTWRGFPHLMESDKFYLVLIMFICENMYSIGLNPFCVSLLQLPRYSITNICAHKF